MSRQREIESDRPASGAESAGRRMRRPRVWYQSGLHFSCTRCGRCCRDQDVPTFVFLEGEDIVAISRLLKLGRQTFLDRFAEPSDEGPVLKNEMGACIFWDAEHGCRVYAARPIQCRTWPFWPSNLRLEKWREAARFCPGCDHGELHNRDEIELACRQMLGGRGDGSLWPGEIPLP